MYDYEPNAESEFDREWSEELAAEQEYYDGEFLDGFQEQIRDWNY